MGIIELLLNKNLIAQGDVAQIQKEIEDAGGDVDSVLLRRGINPYDLLSTKGEYFGLPTRSLEGQTVPFDILKYVPEESATFYKFVPVGLKDGILEVGLVDPDNIAARDALNFISSKVNLPFKIFLISHEDFERVLEMYKGLSGEVTSALKELDTELSIDTNTAPQDEAAITTGAGGTRIIEDAPVTKIVATIIHYATTGRASDIHIEPMEEKVRIRFRVDGILNTSLTLPIKVHSALVARIKILCNMRLDEKRKPQDGRFTAKIDGKKVDFRVSTFPSFFGEKIVMRILDTSKGIRTLAELGLSEKNQKALRDAIDRPYGIILISGPTGSGKSTTLYSMLNEIDRETKNVLSLEDPVEYNIEGMNQSQVHPEIGYTFATGLRTTLRQDPDVIMVGEIRDKETAQLAIQAALTGHLVLSTIHTNDAAGVIPRLLDMGVDPFLIAPTLILAVAQRLVRVLCPGGGKPIPIEGPIKTVFDNAFQDLAPQYKNEITFTDKVYEAVPTAECPKGTSGRVSVMEVLVMDSDLEQVVLKNPTGPAVFEAARAKGMLTMKEDAIIKAMKGVIPFEEVSAL